MKTRPKEEIALTAKELKERISNFDEELREAYNICVFLLEDALLKPSLKEAETIDESDLQTEVFRKQIQAITKVGSLRARSIIVMCIDWINGYDSDFLLKFNSDERGQGE